MPVPYSPTKTPRATPRSCRACMAGQPRRQAPAHRGTGRVQVTPQARPARASLRFSAGSGPRAPSPPCQYTQPRPWPQGHTAPESGPSSGSESDGNKCTPGRAGGRALARRRGDRSRTAGAPALPSGPGRLVPAGGRATAGAPRAGPPGAALPGCRRRRLPVTPDPVARRHSVSRNTILFKP